LVKKCRSPLVGSTEPSHHQPVWANRSAKQKAETRCQNGSRERSRKAVAPIFHQATGKKIGKIRGVVAKERR